jgi:hypothetical protein
MVYGTSEGPQGGQRASKQAVDHAQFQKLPQSEQCLRLRNTVVGSQFGPRSEERLLVQM